MIEKLSSHQLEAFHCVCQVKNFTKAAAKLGLTQSALSQRVMNLEAVLDTTLIIRERRGFRLTQAGQQLLRYCQTKEALENDFISKLKSSAPDELAGTIRIAGFSSIMSSVVLPLFSGLLKKHPKLQLVLLARELDELPDMLQRGEVDFILMDQVLEKNDWAKHTIGIEENVLVEKKGYSGLNVFLENDENELTTRQYFGLKAHQKKEIYSSYYVDDIYGIVSGLREGIGRAVLPKHLIKNESHLKILRPSVVLEVPVVLHYFEQPYYSQLHQEVVSLLTERFRSAIKG